MTITTVTGIVAVLLGAVYTAQAWNLPRATVGVPMGPILFPLILGVGMTVLGAMLIVQEHLRLKRPASAGKTAVSFKLTVFGKSIAIVTGFCVLYVMLFEFLGYVLSTFLFLGAVLLLFNGKGRWKISLIVATCFSVGVYVLFGSVLSIQLPRMPLLGF
jgi:putative tricarboxylic transport membrane protein